VPSSDQLRYSGKLFSGKPGYALRAGIRKNGVGGLEMKITIIFPARDLEPVASLLPVMPLAPTLLAALTPREHEVSLVDMIYGDTVDFEADVDVVAVLPNRCINSTLR
jgi:hypothetical protein